MEYRDDLRRPFTAVWLGWGLYFLIAESISVWYHRTGRGHNATFSSLVKRFLIAPDGTRRRLTHISLATFFGWLILHLFGND